MSGRGPTSRWSALGEGSPRCRKGRVGGGQSTYSSPTHGADGTTDQRPFAASSQGTGHRSSAAADQGAVDGALVRIVGAANQCEKAQDQACATHRSSFRLFRAERGEQHRVSPTLRIAVSESGSTAASVTESEAELRNQVLAHGKLIQINAK